MLLQIRPCPGCGLRTYHRYHNALRCGLVARSHWQCLECGHKEPAEIPAHALAPTPARLEIRRD
ncbi:MAG: hypothetical protein AB7E32_03705 [Desulfovibrio sp.]